MKEKQSGFGVLGVVLLVLVVVGVGFTGYLVQHKLTADKTVSATMASKVSSTRQSSTAATATTKPAASQQNYLKVTEWGVQLTLDQSIADAYYNGPQTTPNGDAIIKLGTKSLSALDPSCAADGSSYMGISQESTAMYTANKASSTPDLHTVQIGAYYYGFIPAQAACSTNDAANQLQLTQVQAFKKAFSSLQTLN